MTVMQPRESLQPSTSGRSGAVLGRKRPGFRGRGWPRATSACALVGMLLASLSQAGGNDPVSILDETEGIVAPFPDGERLRYAIYWDPPALLAWLIGDIQAGVLTLDVAKSDFGGRPTYTITADASTTGFVRRRVLEVDDRFVSHIDRRDYRSYGMTKRIREGKKKRRDVVVSFDYVHNSIQVQKTDLKPDGPDKETKTIRGIPGPLADILSVFYVARLRSMGPSQRYRIDLADEAEPSRVEVEVLKRERIKTRLGRFESVRISTVGGFFTGAGGFLIWYSTDEERLPIRFQADARVGKIYGELIGVDRGSHSRGLIKIGKRPKRD